jgi:hypothetical protein
MYILLEISKIHLVSALHYKFFVIILHNSVAYRIRIDFKF